MSELPYSAQWYINHYEKRIKRILEVHQNRLDELNAVKGELSLARQENKRLQRAIDAQRETFARTIENIEAGLR